MDMGVEQHKGLMTQILVVCSPDAHSLNPDLEIFWWTFHSGGIVPKEQQLSDLLHWPGGNNRVGGSLKSLISAAIL